MSHTLLARTDTAAGLWTTPAPVLRSARPGPAARGGPAPPTGVIRSCPAPARRSRDPGGPL
ncbi:hypothetical protein ACWEN3_36735, partial [Streptomyces sp. NPDC004561]